MRAILVTENSAEKIAIINDGIAPNVDEVPTYFIDPEDKNGKNAILSAEIFFDNYRFAGIPGDDDYFVEIREI